MRVLFVSDLHCGSKVGLTPPKWHLKSKDKWNKTRMNLWNDFNSQIQKVKPVDILIINGDAIDGTRSGGREQYVSDCLDQVEMATEVVSTISPGETYLTMGTPFHVGDKENWEEVLAQKISAKQMEDHLFLNLGGTIFDIKHHIPGTSVPHSKGYQISKAHVWNLLWAERDIQHRADVTIRSHVHTFFYTGDDIWLGITTPALMGYGSRYGSRYYMNVVHIGFVWFDIEKGGYNWGHTIFKGEYLKSNPVVISPKRI